MSSSYLWAGLFPAGASSPAGRPLADLGLLRALETESRRPTPAELWITAEAWRPWRAYAAMRLWAQSSQGPLVPLWR